MVAWYYFFYTIVLSYKWLKEVATWLLSGWFWLINIKIVHILNYTQLFLCSSGLFPCSGCYTFAWCQYVVRHTTWLSFVTTECDMVKVATYLDSCSCYNFISIHHQYISCMHGFYPTEMYLSSYKVWCIYNYMWKY